MILLIDNYDSFSYNLFQLVGAINDDIKIIRNDEMTVDEIKELAPSHIILSPGPKRPKDAGVCICLLYTSMTCMRRAVLHIRPVRNAYGVPFLPAPAPFLTLTSLWEARG